VIRAAVGDTDLDNARLTAVPAELYLRKAFPHGLPLRGTTAQQTLSRVVGAHERAWQGDPRWTRALSRIGLPIEREAWLASAG
jgi:hypothetical protein